ncbi:MAG: peptidylprolyl isomerase [Oscillospiraceae bacterium]|nr:peptidylprolyl isomerase [Oscillospiraceae bacterium]
MKKPIATITMKDGRKLVLELYPEIAPNTVNNFIDLANSGQYDGLTFHRIVKDFMIQGGSPNGSCASASAFNIKGEFANNGIENNISHKAGVISMARAGHPDSASTQFFIMHGDGEFLDGQYAAFGKLIEGAELLKELGNVPTANTQDNPPLEPVLTKDIRVEPGDWKAEEPKRIIPPIR